jgi:hypothetical protein
MPIRDGFGDAGQGGMGNNGGKPEDSQPRHERSMAAMKMCAYGRAHSGLRRK